MSLDFDRASFAELVEAFSPISISTQTLADQLRTWAAGTATGGPAGDGRYPVGTASPLSPAAMAARLPTGQPIDLTIECFANQAIVRPGTRVAAVRASCAMTLTSVRASLFAPDQSALGTGGLRIDILANGASILSAPLRILPGQLTSQAVGTPPATLATISIPDDAEISVNVLAAGLGTKGLYVVLIGSRA